MSRKEDDEREPPVVTFWLLAPGFWPGNFWGFLRGFLGVL